MCVGNFLPLMLIYWICHFVYQKSLKQTFKTGFWVLITFWVCFLVLWVLKGYFVVKKQVFNVGIKAFWYRKHIVRSRRMWIYCSGVLTGIIIVTMFNLLSFAFQSVKEVEISRSYQSDMQFRNSNNQIIENFENVTR